MKVSILIPVYGVERFMAESAESLFAQSYKDIEYVFVDDCSPDGSIAVMQEVLERFPERKGQVKVLRHEANSGVGQARDTAFQAATGKFITHADPDDLLPEDAIEAMVECQKKTGADVVDGGYEMFDGKDFSETVMPFQGSDEKHLKTALCPALLPGRLWGRLYRRSLLLRHHISTERGIDCAEDYSVTARCFLHAKRAVLDKVVYRYRVLTGGTYSDHVSQKNIVSILKSAQVVYDYFLKNDAEHTYTAALQFGMLHTIRSMRKNGASNALIAEYLHYKPKGYIFRLLHQALIGGLPMKIADPIYRMARGFYLKFS